MSYHRHTLKLPLSFCFLSLTYWHIDSLVKVTFYVSNGSEGRCVADRLTETLRYENPRSKAISPCRVMKLVRLFKNYPQQVITSASSNLLVIRHSFIISKNPWLLLAVKVTWPWLIFGYPDGNLRVKSLADTIKSDFGSILPSTVLRCDTQNNGDTLSVVHCCFVISRLTFSWGSFSIKMQVVIYKTKLSFVSIILTKISLSMNGQS